MHSALQVILRRVTTHVHSRAVVDDKYDVGQLGGMVLLLLAQTGQRSQKEIACELQRDKSQLSKKLVELESKGLLTRTRSEEDARIVLFELTKLGVSHAALLLGWYKEGLDKIMKPISEDERATLAGLLFKIANNGSDGAP